MELLAVPDCGRKLWCRDFLAQTTPTPSLLAVLLPLKHRLSPLSPCRMRLVTVFSLTEQHEAIDVRPCRLFE